MKPLPAAAALLAFAMAAQAMAGTSFRLEVGPPIAGGTSNKLLKNGKKVVLAVRPILCEDLATLRITGTAEGIVNGARQSIPLNLVTVDATKGVHAVQQQWPNDGQWVLQLNGSCATPKASASTIVPFGRNGFMREKTEVLREPATPAQVEAALRRIQ